MTRFLSQHDLQALVSFVEVCGYVMKWRFPFHSFRNGETTHMEIARMFELYAIHRYEIVLLTR